VPRQIVPDNLKAGVLKANWHEPGLNPTYQDFAIHYGTAILPARPRRPRDKAKVEVGVQVVERWILARLRDQRFFAFVCGRFAIGLQKPSEMADEVRIAKKFGPVSADISCCFGLAHYRTPAIEKGTTVLRTSQVEAQMMFGQDD
jgi:hypothetical protein